MDQEQDSLVAQLKNDLNQLKMGSEKKLDDVI
jgi:hypothetical protein